MTLLANAGTSLLPQIRLLPSLTVYSILWPEPYCFSPTRLMPMTLLPGSSRLSTAQECNGPDDDEQDNGQEPELPGPETEGSGQQERQHEHCGQPDQDNPHLADHVPRLSCWRR